MTKRDLFRILIKLTGIYACIVIIINLVKNLSFIGSLGIDSYKLLLGILLFSIVGLTVMIYIIIKPNTIINLLKLDKGYDDNKLDVHINFTTMVSLILILSACYLFVDNIGLLINNIIFNIYESQTMMYNTNLTGKIFYPATNIIISTLLLLYYHPIAKYIVTKGSKQPTDTPDL